MMNNEPDPPSTEPLDQSKDIPNQRGTSSGEIGQNPVEIVGRKPLSPKNRDK